MPRNTHNAGPPQGHYAGQLQPSLGPSALYSEQPRVTAAAAAAAAASYYPVPSSSSSALALPDHHHHHHQPEPDYGAYDAGDAVPVPPPPPPPATHRASSGAWSPQGDQHLVARMQGLNWGQIKDVYFPSKTANACRKRHERLMERRGADDWDNRKLQQMAQEYMSMRKEIWSGLAARTGEKWTVVEQKCMSNGLKNLQSAARAATRRNRLETSSHVTGYDDDSGISGIGLTPVDELDAPYSSPEMGSSGSVGYTYHHQHHQQPHHAAAHLQATPAAAAGGLYAVGAYAAGVAVPGGRHHAYSSSSSSSASAAGRRHYAAAAHPRGHGQGGSPYLDAQRVSTADMGIGAIINRPGGRNRAA